MFSAEHVAAIHAARAVWAAAGGAGGTGSAGRAGPVDALYAGWWAAPRPGLPIPAPVPGVPPLGGRLRVADGGHRRWLPGCRVVALGRADVVVVTTPAGRRRALSRGDYWVPGRPGLAARVGDEVVGIDRSGGYESDGWWRAWGGGWNPATPTPDTTRLYLAIDPAHVLDVADRLPAALERAGIGWTLKVAALDGMLARPDAVVGYVHDADRDRAFDVVGGAAEGLLLGGPEIPFAARLAPGLSWSEDPAGEESFGQLCCRLLDAAFRAGGDPIAAADGTFRAAGVDPARPHRRASA